jgi:hypothetical protein
MSHRGRYILDEALSAEFATLVMAVSRLSRRSPRNYPTASPCGCQRRRDVPGGDDNGPESP